MSSRFKPFDLGGAGTTPEKSSFKVKVMPSDDTTREFKPLAGMLKKTAADMEENSNGEPEAPARKSDVVLERDEQENIKRIVVQCACGRKHELDCDY